MKFSVLLSVYREEKAFFLSEAIRSIWSDQILKPNQIVLVQDGPLTVDLDSEIAIWKSKLGDVLTVVQLPNNVGLAAALNHGLQYCQYDLVARMDTDDISIPDRFKCQIAFMYANPQIAVSSGFIEEWNYDMSEKISTRALPLQHDDIAKFAKMRSPISHPACIFRKSVILDVGEYPDVYPEDYLLWVRVIMSGHKLANIPQILLQMRTGDNFIARRGYKFLKGELLSYQIMYQSGFINFWQFIKVVFMKSLVRLSPAFIKSWLYKNVR